MNLRRLAALVAVTAVSFVLPVSAGATVKKEGSWPTADKRVDLEVDGPPSKALKELAREAGWSLVLSDGAGIDRAGPEVHVAVENQPADAVLDALFVGRDVVAHRSGPLVTIVAANAAPGAQPGVEPTPTPAAFPTARGDDREVIGQNLVIQANEIVHDVTVTGGSTTVKGTVTGNLVVTGGSATLKGGAHVVGNATVLGGKLRVEKDARIDGSVHVTGGSIHRAEGSVIGGTTESEAAPRSVSASHDVPEPTSRAASAARSIGRALTRASLLFVLGCVLMALLAPRMERLRVEVAARPMRAFALGIVGSLVGSFGLVVALALLCITVIGIPVALALVLALVLALYGSVTSVLTTFGAAVAGHRTANGYLHLLVGCGAFLVVTCIPWIGGLASAIVMMTALGSLIATRGAGLFERNVRGALTA